jgi:hypothetical protein
MTKLKRPKVISTAGSVRILRSEPMNALIIPKSRATQRYVQKPPLIVIPERKDVATQNASARVAKRTRSFMP